MSSDDRNLARKVAIGAVIGIGGAIGLYYLLKKLRAPAPGANPTLDGKTVDQLKALGNQLFAEKKYHEAIEVFSRAINLDEAGSETTKAMCYQNRGASKEKASGYNLEDCLRDYACAVEYNPSYAKAYLRTAVILYKQKNFREALKEIFCATHLDGSLDRTAGAYLPLILEELEKENHSEFNKEFSPGTHKHVRHERVYAWLNKTVVNDQLKNLIGSTNFDGKLGEAIRLVQEQKYDEVACVAAEETDPSRRLEAVLLAAKFYAYENRKAEFQKCLDEFDAEFNNLIDPEKEVKKPLLSSRNVIAIETATSKEDIMKFFYNAISTDIHNVDYYAMAAFRLVIYGEAHEAMRILSTEELNDNNNIKLLRLTLGILANTDGNLDAARLHGAIMELEGFVNGLENPSSYARTLLAKVYSTFSQPELALPLMDRVLRDEPEQSIHYFDRSCMAQSGEEAMTFLKSCLDIEPYHAEANLMFVSLKLNEFGNRLLTSDEQEEMMGYVNKAIESFDGAPDFPVITSVFRIREILRAKRAAALQILKE